MRRLIAGFVVGLLTIPVLFVSGAVLGLWSTTANSVPPRWETALAGAALRASAARRAPHVTNPVPLSDENLTAGMKTYNDACAGCHGDPSANSDYGASFYPSPPQFAKNPPQKPDWQLFWIIRNGVRYSGMSAWDRQWHNDEKVSDDHIWKVVLFLSHIDRLPPDVDKEWRRQNQ
jgi:mono/diheme cytochrome c family protein